MDKKIIIETKDLSYTYFGNYENSNEDNVTALRNVDFTVYEGEYIAVLGHNGSGKSTLAKLLNLILIPTSGQIFIDGKDVSSPDLSEDEVFDVRRKIGMVFQNPDNQLVATVVEEDVAFGPENLGLPREEIRRRVKSALNLVGMQDYTRHAPHKLSGGQKQRVAIAGVIAMKPKVIIFDESTAMLDPIGRRDVLAIMEKLNREEGTTVINITHYMDEAARADRVLVINDGEIRMDNSPREVFSRVDELHTLGLEAPQGVELINKLKNKGFDLKGRALSVDECVDTLYGFLSSFGENNG